MSLDSTDGPVAVRNHEFIMNVLFTSPTNAREGLKSFTIRGLHTAKIYHKNKKVRRGEGWTGIINKQSKMEHDI